MEYNYELLRKCDRLRFRAEFYALPKEGVIKVAEDCVYLCYGNDVLRPEFDYKKTLKVLEGQPLNCGRISHFEIVPRDPETYQDWQVGDKVTERPGETQTVIFRSGELMVTKRFNGEASCPFTCGEFFEKGYRLVLTDIEKQIIEERTKAEWKPQDGDICYLSANNRWIFVNKKDSAFHYVLYVGLCLERDRIYYNGNVIFTTPAEFRPATDEEKQRLFDAMARAGKRWNAEKKVVEDIPAETKTAKHDFKKFDPVLVRDSDGSPWTPGVFDSKRNNDNSVFKYTVMGCVPYAQCIPLNEKTEHLLGTSDNYEEEQL